MTADPPPPDLPSPSLVGRVRAALASAPASAPAGGDRRVAVAVAALIALAPLLTWAGARWQEARERGATAALMREAAPRLARDSARDAARAAFAPLLARPTLGATVEALARTLPAEANVVRVEQAQAGRLSIEVAGPDPDKLRAALRRDPATQGLRDAGQRAGDGGMVVTFEGER